MQGFGCFFEFYGDRSDRNSFEIMPLDDTAARGRQLCEAAVQGFDLSIDSRKVILIAIAPCHQMLRQLVDVAGTLVPQLSKKVLRPPFCHLKQERTDVFFRIELALQGSGREFDINLLDDIVDTIGKRRVPPRCRKYKSVMALKQRGQTVDLSIGVIHVVLHDTHGTE